MQTDDRALHDLTAERHATCVEALWHAQCIPEPLFLHLCFECGVDRAEVEAYRDPVLQVPARRNREVKYPNF